MENNFWEEIDRRGEKAKKEFNKDIKICLLLFLVSPIIIILPALFLAFPYIIIPVLFVIGIIILYKKKRNKAKLAAGFYDSSLVREKPKQYKFYCFLLKYLSDKDGGFYNYIREKFQKLKSFYLNKIDTLLKKFFFWLSIIIFFIFLLPFSIGIILIYVISRVKIENFWIKAGLTIFILIVAILTEISWAKNILGMNSSPNISIDSPIMKTIEIKGIDIIEISGKIKPAGSIIKINGDKVEMTKDGNFTKEISINKGKNEIKIIGKHGSGTTEKIITVNRILTDEELAEEKRIQEERQVRAEEERKIRQEAAKKAEEENRLKKEEAEKEVRMLEEKKIQELADMFCSNRSKTNVRYANLNDVAVWLETGQAMQIRNVYNQTPSKTSCRKVAEQCLKGLVGWSEVECKGVAGRNVWIGMTSEQLVVSQGSPKRKNNTVTVWGISTQWVYGDFGPYIYLKGDNENDLVVTSWQD